MKPKRLISLLVAVCMMITMLPLSAVTAFAADTSTVHEANDDEGIYKYAYTVNNGNATITKFLGPVDSEGNVDSTNHGPYNITIPDKLGGCPVTGLGDHSFAAYPISYQDNYENPLCSNIHSVTIPQSVTSIGYEAFCHCKNLQSLTLEGSIESMGDGAFAYCTSLKTFPLVGNIQKIGDYTFYRCDDLENVTIPESVTSIGKYAFEYCYALGNVTIPQSVTSIGDWAFDNCSSLKLTTPSFGEKLQTIGEYAFRKCGLNEVTIPQSVTSIGWGAFSECYGLGSLTIKDATTSIGGYAFSDCWSLATPKLGEHITTIGKGAFESCYTLDNVTIPQSVTSIGDKAFEDCRYLSTITIPEKVEKIESKTFDGCRQLESITLPAGLTSFEARLNNCPTDCVIYFNNNEATALDRFGSNTKLAGRKLLCLCNVTFDANGGTLTDKGGTPTNHAVVSAYKTQKINADDLKAIPNPTRAGYNFTGWYTEKNQSENDQPFNVNEIITKDMTEDITFYAHWVPVYHPLTVTGGTVTVKKDGQSLNIVPVVTGGKKTYYVPEGAEVTVTLDKTAVPNGKVFDGWSTSLPTGQDYKAESITFTMNSGVDIAAQYRDAATDHTPDTAVCHPLTVTGGIVTVKNGDKDVTDTLTVTTDETTGQKTYSVPDGATVTVTLDKTLVPEGMVFDIWSTGKFSLPLGQDYKAESITFPMSSDVVDIAAQYRDATIEDDGPNVLGTAAIIGTAAVGTAVLGYQAYSLGAEFAGKLMALPYFPSNRSALAMMLWEDAGKPMPESELLYPDVGQEERDMDLQHAARWAMENELIPDLNDEGTAPEEMKFFPANPVSKLDVLNAWQKAQELKNN